MNIQLSLRRKVFLRLIINLKICHKTKIDKLLVALCSVVVLTNLTKEGRTNSTKDYGTTFNFSKARNLITALYFHIIGYVLVLHCIVC